MSKTMLNIIRTLILVVLVGLLAGGIMWARWRASADLCSDVTVEIMNRESSTFVTPDSIKSELKRLNINLVGRKMSDINTQELESKLSESSYFDEVECVKWQGAKGPVIHIRAKQIVPVMRVFDGSTSYYVSRTGKRMTAINRYHADVPVVQGHFYKTFTPLKMLPLIDYVESDSLLKSLVSMYTFRDSNNVMIVPTISGHVVNLGDVNNYESKFNKLLLFYRKVMPEKGWMTYDTISVKWNYQVVASKRTKAVKEVIDWSEGEDEPDPDLELLRDDGAATDTLKHDKQN